MVTMKENELYQEIELFNEDKMISRLTIFEPYQNIGYGTEVVKMLKNKYGCDCLWVTADNEHAMHVYEKCGFRKVKPTMYLMEMRHGNIEG